MFTNDPDRLPQRQSYGCGASFVPGFRDRIEYWLRRRVGGWRPLARWLLPVCAAMVSSGCYLMQAAAGQMEITARRQPIATLLADANTPAALRGRLAYVAEARDFAVRELGLPDNGSYRSYADLERPYVVWNVFATEEFSVEPRRWCFPIAGCVVYRGYFSEASAQRYARRLRAAGKDTAVSGVSAYSTLGHFDDPVLSTMLGWSDARLAATVFHELAHQVIYLPGESRFNESFAMVVEEAGLERWLMQRGQPDELADWRQRRRREAMFIRALLHTREQLRSLYASDLPTARKRERKQYAFGLLKLEYARMREVWHGSHGYDAWFDRTLNNAHLVPAATYHGCVPGLRRLLASVGGDLPRFYERVRMLAKLDRATREREVCGDLHDWREGSAHEPFSAMHSLDAWLKKVHERNGRPDVASDREG
ncbi:putative aminopeptidase [Steroidobacter denitrificans]|uniref:Putative aminopeptidase n=1 Tax=Steroidobacter denitrificans TaxID=465721 RepID=A0A127F5K7_STEDE|nr:aminopeptidase [Steroidobacter denitrificans]AMN45734.1 putative aminopeptidase [Steroidobacter denitrificans]